MLNETLSRGNVVVKPLEELTKMWLLNTYLLKASSFSHTYTHTHMRTLLRSILEKQKLGHVSGTGAVVKSTKLTSFIFRGRKSTKNKLK